MKKITLEPMSQKRAENHRAVTNLLVYLLLALGIAITSIILYITGARIDPVLMF